MPVGRFEKVYTSGATARAVLSQERPSETTSCARLISDGGAFRPSPDSFGWAGL